MNCLGISVGCRALSSLLAPSRQWLENAECAEESGSAWVFSFSSFFFLQTRSSRLSYSLSSSHFVSFFFIFESLPKDLCMTKNCDGYVCSSVLCIRKAELSSFLKEHYSPCVELVYFSNRVTVVQFSFQCQRIQQWHLSPHSFHLWIMPAEVGWYSKWVGFGLFIP